MSDKITDEALAEMTDRHDYWEKYLVRWKADNPTIARSNALETLKPFEAIAALMLLEKGETRKSIRQKFGWNHYTVVNFEARHTLTIQENRRHFSRKFAMTVEAGLEVLHKKFHMLLEDDDALSKADVKSVAIAVGIMTDKGAQMDGMASQIVEHRNADANVGDAFEFIKAAKERAAQKAIEVEAEIIS